MSSVLFWFSLCNLCVLCVSVVSEFPAIVNHRDTEHAEVAQRRIQIKTPLRNAQFLAAVARGGPVSRIDRAGTRSIRGKLVQSGRSVE
jgi:hypothetical protein